LLTSGVCPLEIGLGIETWWKYSHKSDNPTAGAFRDSRPPLLHVVPGLVTILRDLEDSSIKDPSALSEGRRVKKRTCGSLTLLNARLSRMRKWQA
jgi:hypothetical protein